jgi:filamentous hemagglutinin family protein
MLKALFTWLGLSLCTLGYLGSPNNSVVAQVTSDGTVNTQVTENGKTAEITGGETREGNLFHSFEDFSVKTGNEAFFNNADSISNIFSRVTGGNVSDIDGAIRANGSANLFLINPAGILFGENASLNIGGSFYGSSASSILFEDGEFSATNLDNPPLLTVNAPIGLGFRDEPGDIVNRASTNGFAVETGKNIALIGGNVSIENGAIVFAAEGRIELGGLTESGIISFTEDNSLSFPDAVARGDVSLTDSGRVFVSASADDMAPGQAGNIKITTGSLTLNNGSALAADGDTQDRGGNVTIDATKNVSFANGSNIFVVGAEGGSIQLDAKSLSITSGSNFLNGISEDSGFTEAQSGDININATENVVIDGQGIETLTAINNSVYDNAIGNAGEINISARNLSLINGGQIQGFVSGQGNSSDITLNARKNISINAANDSSNSGVNSFIADSGKGNSGTTNITAQNLTLSNGGSILSTVAGVGDSGDINIKVKDSLAVDGEASLADGEISLPSKISSTLGFDAEGNPASGNSGDINITTTKLSLTNEGLLEVSTFGIGNAGNIDINAKENISLDGLITQGGSSSAIASRVFPSAEGNAGNIEITTSRLSLTNGGGIQANTFGIGNAGNIKIDATESITLDGTESITQDGTTLEAGSSITSGVQLNAEGNGGNIQISTGDFTISNNAGVDTSTFGRGNGGEVNITSNNLFLSNGSSVGASTLGLDPDNVTEGNAGDITINVADTLSVDGTNTVDSQGQVVETPAGIFTSNLGDRIGNAGNIEVTASKLSLTNGSQINSFSRDRGDAGNIKINVADSILLDAGNESEVVTGISTELEENGVGNGGETKINTNNLSIFNGAIIRNAAFGEGDAGNTTINAQNSIFLRNNSSISNEAANGANGGNLTIDSNFVVAFPNQNNDIVANAQQGNGGNITINAESVLGIEERPLNKLTNDINASSNVFGLDGRININTSDINPVQGATELPSNVVETKQTAEQTCSASREGKANNGLAIAGKGGVSPAPDAPLNSESINNEPVQANIPQPLETSQGKIQPARGIMVTESGKIALTAYRTNNAGERIPEAKVNCGQI